MIGLHLHHAKHGSIRARTFVACVAVTVLLPAAASAASFDCAKARLADEHAVCASRALNDRDVEMAMLYGVDRKFLAMGGRGALIDAQTQWLARRRQCGADRACLTRLYDRRIAELRKIIDYVASHGPF